MHALRFIIVPIHREGWKFIAIFAVATLVLFWVWDFLGWLGVLATCWCVAFFRDPQRSTPTRGGLVLAPADGVVQLVERAVPPADLGLPPDPRWRVSIFMNVFDVHVNRIPVDGTVTALSYRPGRFLDASLDKASEENERQAIRITTDDGKDIVLVQIAGLVARRILCELNDKQVVRAGERFGMIRFGSRVDVYLEDGMMPLVTLDQRTVGGETVIADFLSTEMQPRSGEAR